MKKLSLFIFVLLLSINCTVSPGSDNPEITAQEIKEHVTYLASDELKGRFTGTDELKTAADYIKDEFESYGLKPAFDGSFFQAFPFTAGLELTSKNSLVITSGDEETSPELSKDFTTAPFSGDADVEGKLVYAGYGISAPDLNYDDYADIDVKDKIVLVTRYSPEYDNPHSEFESHASFRLKASAARDKGAAGIIFVTGHQPKDDEDKLMELKHDRGGSIKGFPVVHIKRSVADELFKKEGLDFSAYQQRITEDKKPASFEFKNTTAHLVTEVKEIEKTSWNVAGIIEGTDPQLKNEYIVIGAHFDHLGMGGEGSLYRGAEQLIHNGADDNASGTTGVLELAEKFASVKDNLKRSIIFILFSGEELGLLGSDYFVNHSPVDVKNMTAMINMDMIGRLNESNELIVYGAGTSPGWKDLVNSKNSESFKLTYHDEGYGPSDHSSFYGKEIPVLFFFTGTHSDYHRPSDDADKINTAGEEKILKLVYDVASATINADSKPQYVNVPRKDSGTTGGWKVYVGTIPDYANTSDGFRITGVSEGSPAQKGGLKGGDIMLSFGGKPISNIYDYVYALQEFVPGDVVEVVVKRNDEQLSLQVELGAR